MDSYTLKEIWTSGHHTALAFYSTLSNSSIGNNNYTVVRVLIYNTLLFYNMLE